MHLEKFRKADVLREGQKRKHTFDEGRDKGPGSKETSLYLRRNHLHLRPDLLKELPLKELHNHLQDQESLQQEELLLVQQKPQRLQKGVSRLMRKTGPAYMPKTTSALVSDHLGQVNTRFQNQTPPQEKEMFMRRNLRQQKLLRFASFGTQKNP